MPYDDHSDLRISEEFRIQMRENIGLGKVNLFALRPTDQDNFEIPNSLNSVNMMAFASLATGHPLWNGNRPGEHTYIAAHGEPRTADGRISQNDQDAIDEIVNKCSNNTYDNTTDILFTIMCYFDQGKAKELARRTKKNVLHANGDVVMRSITKEGDILITTKNGGKLQMTSPYGVSYNLGTKYIIPRTEEMSETHTYVPAHMIAASLDQAVFSFLENNVISRGQVEQIRTETYAHARVQKLVDTINNNETPDIDNISEELREGIRSKLGDEYQLIPVIPDEDNGDGMTVSDEMEIKSKITGHSLSTGHKPGTHTIVATHGRGPRFENNVSKIWSAEDNKRVQKIIRLTKSKKKCEDLLILSMCNVDTTMAEYISKQTNRPVIFGDKDTVLEVLSRKNGDIVIKTETGRNLKIAYPDKRKTIEMKGSTFILPRTREMGEKIDKESLEQTKNRIKELYMRKYKKTTPIKEIPLGTMSNTEIQKLITNGAMSSPQPKILPKIKEPSKTKKNKKASKLNKLFGR